MKRIAAVIAAVMLCLSGCGYEDATYQPAYFDDESSSAYRNVSEPARSTSSVVLPSIPQSTLLPAPDPEITLTPRFSENKLTFTVEGVYSAGKFYTVDITGRKSADQTAAPDNKTTYVNGVLYGEFRLKSSLHGELTGLVNIEIPRDDKFLIMNSVTENLTYGCEVISNYRQFGTAEYPDIIELDFYINGELEVPQYSRFFAVINNEITEILVYENDAPSTPRGSHLEPKSAGRMVQHLTISTGRPDSYEIAKYEYIYDLENHRLNRKRVRFYGWEID
ncbi:MAG: hypothetical protein K2N06_03925 [Oscillospiraceae bacterium]|nr:hypothetical protein [Oscillospiraceae bacterium]